MPCYHPIKGYRSRTGRDPVTGKWPVVFDFKNGYLDKQVTIPCGKCIGCRLDRSRQWAVRCVHESRLYDQNSFITLTYKDNPESLNVEDFQKFMKRLRKKYHGKSIRFFHCGEYGDNFNRPHHHACLFNHDFDDKKLWKKTEGGNLYISEELNNLWPYGYHLIGSVTWESAAYVARYVTKKITGEKAEEHYNGRKPEYITMSRKPGIGKNYWDRYKSDMLAIDQVVMRDGKLLRVPRFYDKLLEIDDPEAINRIRNNRQRGKNEVTQEDLNRMEEYRKVIIEKNLKRKLESGCTNV